MHGVFGDASDLDTIDASPASGSWARTPSWPASQARRFGVASYGCSGPRIQNVTASWRNDRILLAADLPNPDGDQPACCRFTARTLALSMVADRSGHVLRVGTRHTVAARGAPPRRAVVVMSNAYAADGMPVARSPVPRNPTRNRHRRRQAGRSCRSKGAFVIDVGATQVPPVAPLADQVQISEDARGALFTAGMPTGASTARLS